MEIRNLNFSYGRHRVLKNFSCDFEKGKITTILGSNGSGKSTLFKICTKELRPRSGLIRLNGKNINRIDRRDFAKQVAIVHQQNMVSGDIEVRDLVFYGRNPHIPFMGSPQEIDHRKVDQAIYLCGLKGLEGKRVNELSGGQIQRVWIAMALAQDTDFLFLDEPTTYLDIKYQIEILDLVKDLNRTLGKTIVMILHDINQSIKYSDIIVGMMDGKITFQGQVDQVLTAEKISQIYDTSLKIVNLDNKKYVLAQD